MSDSASSTKSKTWMWWGLAIATLLLGFADLARGGETIAPILLVIGYCVLVPIAILK
jgi:amino acid transporter